MLCTPLGRTGAFLPERWFLRIPPNPASQGTPGGRPPVPTTEKSLRNPLSCQMRNTNANWTQTHIKERHTQRAGPVGRSRSLASRRDTFLCNSGTEALGPLWGVGVKKYRDYSLPAGSTQGWGRPNLNFFSFWFRVGPFPGAPARRPRPHPRAPPPSAGAGRRCPRAGRSRQGGRGAPREQPSALEGLVRPGAGAARAIALPAPQALEPAGAGARGEAGQRQGAEPHVLARHDELPEAFLVREGVA